MAEESKAISQVVLRAAGLGQSIVVGAAIIFSVWIWLARSWGELLVPERAMSPELASVFLWLGQAGWILLVILLCALLGEIWLGVVRGAFRRLAIRRIRRSPAGAVGQGVFSAVSLDRFSSRAESAREVGDLEPDQEVECRRLVCVWVLEQANRYGALHGDPSLTYEQLRSEAELRAGLLPWGPLAVVVTCVHLNSPPPAVFFAGMLFAVFLTLALFLSARQRWMAANSYLLNALSDGVDWSRFARRAAGLQVS